MANTKAIRQSEKQTSDSERWTEEEAKRHMREFLASLPPPLSFEELARTQGVKPITNIEDLPRWPEDDLEAWDGFEEFIEALRHGQQERVQQERDADLGGS